MARFFARAVAPVALLALATVVALLTAAPAAAQASRCAAASDVGRFVGWCRCTSATVPKRRVAFNGQSSDPWCKVSTPDTRVHFCDAAGLGNCDLQCAAPIHECTAPAAANGVCPCVVGKVRAVLRYNGPLAGSGRA